MMMLYIVVKGKNIEYDDFHHHVRGFICETTIGRSGPKAC